MDQTNWPKISIVVTTYLASNKPYLDACMKSLNNVDYPKEKMDVVLYSSKDKPESYGHKLVMGKKPKHFPASCNEAIANTDPSTEFILILGDDVILTPNSIKSLVSAGLSKRLIVGPISNCDNYYKYHLFLPYVKDQAIHPMGERFFRIDSLKDPQCLMVCNSAYNPGIIFTNFHCFYAVLIPRNIWNDVGTLDENYLTGQDDVDYCIRAKQKGYQIALALDSLIWHFGGVTADKCLTDEIRQQNKDYFTKKWGFAPP